MCLTNPHETPSKTCEISQISWTTTVQTFALEILTLALRWYCRIISDNQYCLLTWSWLSCCPQIAQHGQFWECKELQWSPFWLVKVSTVVGWNSFLSLNHQTLLQSSPVQNMPQLGVTVVVHTRYGALSEQVPGRANKTALEQTSSVSSGSLGAGVKSSPFAKNHNHPMCVFTCD